MASRRSACTFSATTKVRGGSTSAWVTSKRASRWRSTCSRGRTSAGRSVRACHHRRITAVIAKSARALIQRLICRLWIRARLSLQLAVRRPRQGLVFAFVPVPFDVRRRRDIERKDPRLLGLVARPPGRRIGVTELEVGDLDRAAEKLELALRTIAVDDCRMQGATRIAEQVG